MSFATTRWSIVVAAGRQSSADSRDALEALCETYWPALYAYVRRRVASVEEAQDLTQAFFAELLDKNYVGAADRERGRFRSYLFTALQHFLSKDWDKAKAQKRGGGRQPLSLDFGSADSKLEVACGGASGLSAEQLYDREWTCALLSAILARLEREFEEAGKKPTFEALKPFLVGDAAGATYAAASTNLGLSEAAARQAATRLRKRYRELLREEIAQTVENAEEIDDEIRSLFKSLES